MKKVLSFLLCLIMIFSVLTPLSVYAENGPYPLPEGGMDWDNINPEEINFSAIILFDMDEGYAIPLYPEDEDAVLPDDIKSLVSYNLETNTLSLNGLNEKNISLYTIAMGDDFKISLTGYNELSNIISLANKRGGSVALIGDGELVLNRNHGSLSGGLTIISESTSDVFTVEENVKFKAYAYEDYDCNVPSVSVVGSTAEVPFIVNGEITEGTYQEDRYIYEFVKTYLVNDVDNSSTNYYDAAFTKEEDEETQLYIGYEDYEEGYYLLYSISYDSEIDLYVATQINNGEAVNPEELGLTKALSLPLVDEETGFYIGNPEEYTEFGEDVIIKDIFFTDMQIEMNICTSSDGTEYGYIETEGYDEEVGTAYFTYTVYDLLKSEKYGWVAKENPEIESFDDFMPVVTKTEGRIDAYYNDDISVNNGGAVVEPGIVKNIVLSNSIDGIDVTFSPVKGAEYYDFYVFDYENEKWVFFETFKAISKPKYKITNVTTDTQYAFLIVGRNYVGKTPNPTQDSIGYITYRNASKVYYEINKDGNKIKWYRHAEGKNYRVYRQEQGESTWVKIGDTKRGYLTDTTAKAGVKYKYAVRTFFNDGTYTGARSTAYFMRVAQTDVKKATNLADGSVKITWGKTTGADGYRIYRKTANSSWTRLYTDNNPSSTSYIDKTAKEGTTYTYTVKAYNSYSNGTYEPGVTIKVLSMPEFTLSNKENGVRISWSKVSGASKYRVYRKLAGTSTWTKLADTKSLSYTDTKASNGKKYDYAVKALNGSYYSAYSSKTILRLKNPVIKSAEKTLYGVELNWSKVSGAKGYIVYRKTEGASWERLGTVNDIIFTDVSAQEGETYIYTVKAVNGNYVSGYYSVGAKIKA